MKYPINYNRIPKDLEYYSEVIEVHDRAERYLLEFSWCKKIEKSILYVNLGAKLCLFLFKIDNAASREDDYLWVIAGDLPSMYLNTQQDDTTREILKSYVELAEDWINHIRNNEPIDDCYPFNADATIEMADLLARRVSIIRNSVIENIDDLAIEIN